MAQMESRFSELGLVILGAAGYMAENAFDSLKSVKEELAQLTPPATLSVIGTVEPKSELARTVKNRCDGVGYGNARTFEKLDDALKFLDGFIYARDIPILVYDASPASYHNEHLAHIVRSFSSKGLYYLGEKPIFLDRQQLKN